METKRLAWAILQGSAGGPLQERRAPGKKDTSRATLRSLPQGRTSAREHERSSSRNRATATLPASTVPSSSSSLALAVVGLPFFHWQHMLVLGWPLVAGKKNVPSPFSAL